MMTIDSVIEQLRRESSMAYRFTVAMLEAIAAGGGHDQLSPAIDVCDLIGSTEDWTIQQWQHCAQQLAYLLAQQLAERVGCDEAIAGMERQVRVAVDPTRFRAMLLR